MSRSGWSIWVGAEPTFTDRSSEAPEWLFEALGDDKRKRAEQMLTQLASTQSGVAVLRSLGRQYPGEVMPRWSLGLYARRDGTPLWHGPPDPLLTELRSSPQPDVFARALVSVFQSMGLSALRLDPPLGSRVVFRTDGVSPPQSVEEEPVLGRPSLHGERVEGVEAIDSLAEKGNYLITCAERDGLLHAELPAMAEVTLFARVLRALSTAALEIQAPTLALAGFPPPVDETVAWTTLTPDPAVIEVNMAPVARTTDMLQRLRELAHVAEAAGVYSFRLQYNGVESDSGGGGHVTLGGPRPATSPFLTVPSLLPSLVRYFNRHPSLSYLHATESVGPASQAPRVDESLHHALPELSLALELLRRVDNPDPETIWGALSPFLADPSGNTHRAEINIEKLWNPFLGTRGRQGLVEFRALRMGLSPEMTAAFAALLRAVVAMLAAHPDEEPLVDWGDALHQRFSLPFYLLGDLKRVLADLQDAGLGLGTPLVEYLVDDSDMLMTERNLGAFRFELRRAIEFWPLVGDVAAQERGGSRLIDASTSRIEIRLRANERSEELDDWMLAAGDWAIPWQDAEDEVGALRLAGLRYRSFAPWRGLHPTLESQAPLTFTLSHPFEGTWRVTLHEWDPSGEAYPGLPATIAEARRRRRARCIVEPCDAPATPIMHPPKEAIGDHIVDLRWT